MELLLEEPNGIKGAVARCDFIDGPAGFMCCEVNMAPNVGGWKSRFWKAKNLTNAVISRFIEDQGVHISHHDPFRTFCLHIVEDASTEIGVCSDGALNLAVMCAPNYVPAEEGKRLAEGLLRFLVRC